MALGAYNSRRIPVLERILFGGGAIEGRVTVPATYEVRAAPAGK
jgi:hypothetical protein